MAAQGIPREFALEGVEDGVAGRDQLAQGLDALALGGGLELVFVREGLADGTARGVHVQLGKAQLGSHGEDNMLVMFAGTGGALAGGQGRGQLQPGDEGLEVGQVSGTAGVAHRRDGKEGGLQKGAALSDRSMGARMMGG